MTLQSTDRAILTARSGVARAGAIRSGFIPTATNGVTAGSSGGFYAWQQVDLPTTTWTTVKEP
jgi:hypothetical protein